MVPSSLQPRVSPARMLRILSWWRCPGQEKIMVVGSTGEGPGADAVLLPPSPRIGLGQGWLLAGTSCPCVRAREWLGRAAGPRALLEERLFELFTDFHPSSGDCAPRDGSCPARGRVGGLLPTCGGCRSPHLLTSSCFAGKGDGTESAAVATSKVSETVV